MAENNLDLQGSRRLWNNIKAFTNSGFGKGMLLTAVAIIGAWAIGGGAMGLGQAGHLAVNGLPVQTFESGFSQGISKALELLTKSALGIGTVLAGGAVGAVMQSRQQKAAMLAEEAERMADERARMRGHGHHRYRGLSQDGGSAYDSVDEQNAKRMRERDARDEKDEGRRRQQEEYEQRNEERRRRSEQDTQNKEEEQRRIQQQREQEEENRRRAEEMRRQDEQRRQDDQRFGALEQRVSFVENKHLQHNSKLAQLQSDAFDRRDDHVQAVDQLKQADRTHKNNLDDLSTRIDALERNTATSDAIIPASMPAPAAAQDQSAEIAELHKRLNAIERNQAQAPAVPNAIPNKSDINVTIETRTHEEQPRNSPSASAQTGNTMLDDTIKHQTNILQQSATTVSTPMNDAVPAQQADQVSLVATPANSSIYRNVQRGDGYMAAELRRQAQREQNSQQGFGPIM